MIYFCENYRKGAIFLGFLWIVLNFYKNIYLNKNNDEKFYNSSKTKRIRKEYSIISYDEKLFLYIYLMFFFLSDNVLKFV
jgi:hypothetical protein